MNAIILFNYSSYYWAKKKIISEKEQQQQNNNNNPNNDYPLTCWIASILCVYISVARAERKRIKRYV